MHCCTSNHYINVNVFECWYGADIVLQSQNILDLLSGPSAPPPKPEPSNKSAGSDLLDLLGDVDLSSGAGQSTVR